MVRGLVSQHGPPIRAGTFVALRDNQRYPRPRMVHDLLEAHLGTSKSDTTHPRSSGPSLTAGSVVLSAQAVLRPHPTPTRHATHFPDYQVIGHAAPATSLRRSPGRGGPLQFPPPPSIRSAPHTPRSSSRLHFQDLHRFRGLRPDGGGSALPDSHPKAGYIDDAAGFASCYGPHHRSPCHRACDAGLQHRTFPSDAASLLPGLLAATRTGLTPAGDDELTNTKISYINSQPLLPSCWTHSRPCTGCCAGRPRTPRSTPRPRPAHPCSP